MRLIANLSLSLTIVIFRWPIVGFINSRPEALIAASAPHHVLTWTMEREEIICSVNLCHSCLEALQWTGLLQAERRSQFYRSWRSWTGAERRRWRFIKGQTRVSAASKLQHLWWLYSTKAFLNMTMILYPFKEALFIYMQHMSSQFV